MKNLGFTFELKDDIIVFYRFGSIVKSIKGRKVIKFIEFTECHSKNEIQIQIGKLTGNYKRGNEKKSKNHPRNKE